MRCDTCGHDLTVGEWPFCPHGHGHANAITDDVPGGFTVENGFDRPRTFYSKSEHRRALKAEGCEIAAKWAGPLDRYLTRWDAVSPYTLEAATALVTRQRTRSVSETDAVPEGEIAAAATGTTFRVRAT